MIRKGYLKKRSLCFLLFRSLFTTSFILEYQIYLKISKIFEIITKYPDRAASKKKLKPSCNFLLRRIINHCSHFGVWKHEIYLTASDWLIQYLTEFLTICSISHGSSAELFGSLPFLQQGQVEHGIVRVSCYFLLNGQELREQAEQLVLLMSAVCLQQD